MLPPITPILPHIEGPVKTEVTNTVDNVIDSRRLEVEPVCTYFARKR